MAEHFLTNFVISHQCSYFSILLSVLGENKKYQITGEENVTQNHFKFNCLMLSVSCNNALSNQQ